MNKRFWEKVDKTKACWNWTASLKGNGYGQIRDPGTRRNVYAHRMSYEMAHGQIPDGMFVLHTCDNRRCVKPSHLFLGSAADNTADMMAKGRSKLGSGIVHVERTCVHCAGGFRSVHKKQTFCSVQCRNEVLAHRPKRKARAV